MTQIVDYSSLQLRILEESDRDDLASRLPGFIYEAEQEMWQDLRLRVMQRRYFSATPEEGRYMALPDRYLDMYRVFVMSNGRPKRLRAASPAEIIHKYGPGGTVPDYFAVTGMELEFERAPGTALEIEMTYYQAPYNLGFQTTSNETGSTPPKIDPKYVDGNGVVVSNQILEALPYIYLYQSMVKVGLYTDDQEMQAKFGQEYNVSVAKANRNAKYGRITGGPKEAFSTVGNP